MAKHGWKGFGIHQHIAENQPHKVNTLGMNHPVDPKLSLENQQFQLNPYSGTHPPSMPPHPHTK